MINNINEGGSYMNTLPMGRTQLHYNGILYRFMSVSEFNKYLNNEIEYSDKNWMYGNRGVSDKIVSNSTGYCFFDNEAIEKMSPALENGSYDGPLDIMESFDAYIKNRISADAGLYNSIKHLVGINDKDGIVLCKFHYEGELYEGYADYSSEDCDGYYRRYVKEQSMPIYNKINMQLLETIRKWHQN